MSLTEAIEVGSSCGVLNRNYFPDLFKDRNFSFLLSFIQGQSEISNVRIVSV